jgi:hypothetical protein
MRNVKFFNEEYFLRKAKKTFLMIFVIYVITMIFLGLGI